MQSLLDANGIPYDYEGYSKPQEGGSGQRNRPVCPAIRRGLIIEVLFEEIFAIQRNVCTFVLTCYVNNIERIRHFSTN